MRLASASSCCALRNRNDGSGLMLNGFCVKPKKALYILAAGKLKTTASYHAAVRQPTASTEAYCTVSGPGEGDSSRFGGFSGFSGFSGFPTAFTGLIRT